MSAPAFVYRATVIQYAPTAGPDYLWANTWEFEAPAGLIGDPETSRAIADAFRTFHRQLLLPAFGVDRVVLSTYGPDLPFPPGFATFNYRQAGLSQPGGSPMPLSVVAFVRKEVQRGRDGKIFLRGVLTSSLLNGEEFTTGGGPEFPGALAVHAQNLINGLEGRNARIVLASGPVANVQTRTVTALTPVNARTLQYRTRRKTRLQANSLDALRQIFDDGAVDPGEVPALIDAVRGLLGGSLPPLLPPPSTP